MKNKDGRSTWIGRLAALAALCAFALPATAEVSEVRVVKQIGLGFLPLMVMEHEKLIEKHAKAAGLGEVKGTYTTTVGPAIMNDAMLTGRIEVGANGPTSIILIWARTLGTDNEIKGMSPMINSPMWLNTNNPNIKTIRDIGPNERIALPGVKTSNQAVVLQMAVAKEYGMKDFAKLDPQTVVMSHFDGMAALLSKKEITLHLTTPPVMYLELEQPGIRRILSSDDVLGGPTTFTNIFSSSKFRNANPKTYKAVLAAFNEAIERINKDKKWAAQVYLSMANDKKSTLADIQKQLEDPNIQFTTHATNVKKYSDFMFDIGLVKTRANSWKDLYFPDIHDQPGS
jgi:NitT/TauT family transport system substrate-binding protein